MSKDLTAALQELTQQVQTTPQAQPAPKPRGAAPHATGAALLPGGSGGGSGGGGNLSEQNYSLREWHPQMTSSSTDGLLWGRVRAVKKIVLTDDSGQTVSHSYAMPPP